MVDITNPTISVISPTPGSKNNPLDSLIVIQLEDTIGAGTGIDAYSIDVTVNGQYAFNNGILQSGFDGYFFENPDANNLELRFSRNALYDSLESVNVSVSARDLSNNPAATRVFSFIALDTVPPQIVDLIPANNAGQVASNQPITFSIRTTPLETDININTLRVALSGILQDAYGDLVLDAYGNPEEVVMVEPDILGQLVFDQREVAIAANLDGLGYDVQILPVQPYPLASRITVDIYVEDTAGNGVVSQTSFTTADDAAPTLLDPSPLPDSIGNSLATPITFTLADQQGSFPGSGVNKDSIEVTISGVKAIEAGLGQEGFVVDIIENPNLNGYDVVIAPTTLLAPRQATNISIVAADNNFNVFATNYIFTTEDVNPPQIIFFSPRVGSTTNIPQNTSLVVDIESEVAVGELDISSISILVDNMPAFSNNSFQSGFGGLVAATNKQTLTVTITKDTPFSLGQSVTIDAYASDIFGNATSNNIDFTITTNVSLSSSTSPGPGIYDQTDTSPVFPPVGSFLDVALTSNSTGASIAYTTDGSDPTIDGGYAPLGTTTIYTSPIRLTGNGGIIRFFAFDSSTGEIEETNDAVYIFTTCPEDETWNDFALRDGLEYTSSAKLKSSRYDESSLFTIAGEKLGTANYVHDLGRDSFIDSLEFGTNGTTRFRVKVADTQGELLTTPWCNTLTNLVTNQLVEITDGYGPKVSTIGENFRIEGRNQTSPLFSDEATATINEPLFESFTINADMKLIAELDQIVGAKSFLRVRDDSFNLEVQQFVSKTNTIPDSNLIGESSLVGEMSTLYINEGYVSEVNSLTDGYSGFVELVQPPTQLTETLDLILTTSVYIDEEFQLPDNTNDVFSVTSATPSVYNQFVYDDDGLDSNPGDGYSGQTYSSALVAAIYYKRFISDVRTSFAIPVLNKSLDSTSATLISENLDSVKDQFIPAETNDVFSTSIFLEAGDYNFRFHVEREGDTRIVSNPFLFKTRSNLSSVLPGDLLSTDDAIYPIATATKLVTGDYAIEFEKDFPLSTADIPSWSIVRAGSTIIVGSNKIVVDNISQAELGNDANGVVGNLIIDQRREVEFQYASSATTKVSIIATFNNFDAQQNPLIEQLDPAEVEKAFDGSESTVYQNNHPNIHKLTIIPELPLIVDRVRFTTHTPIEAQQRTRLLLDENPVATSNYRARKQNGDTADYLNTVDIKSSIDDGFIEWSYVQIGENANRLLRNSIGLITRFDSFAEHSREHAELSIFTIPELPQLTADYFAPSDTPKIVRNNKSDFAVDGNQVIIKHGQTIQLATTPSSITEIRDDGLIENFIRTNIVIDEPSIANSVYVDAPHLFRVGDRVITSDGVTTLRASILEVSTDNSGLITFDSAIHSEGILVKDYIITERENDFIAQVEVPKFQIVFTSVIRSIDPSPTQTVLYFEDILDSDISEFLGGRLSYPLLSTPAKIIDTRKFQAKEGSKLVNLIQITIDRELLVTKPTLGVTVEIYNSTELATDYVVSKTDDIITCVNQSLLCIGEGVQVSYEATTPAFQAPQQMLCYDAYEADIHKVEVIPTINSVTLGELSAFTIDFFNGVEAQAPEQVTFTVNNHSTTQSKSQALIIDGYQEALYDPAFSNTGQILQFNIPVDQLIPDGYEDLLFDSLSIEYSGQPRYCIGEVEALVDTSIVNSRCRIVLNEQVLYQSDLPVVNNATSKYQIQIDRGSLIVFFNSQCVLQRPILFTNPKFEIGGTGKILDDLVTADFTNITIDQFYNVSPARIQKVGRFIEIEGIVVS